jgi:hypothetical protein
MSPVGGLAANWELPTNSHRKQESTVMGIKTCHVSNNMNGTYDDVLKKTVTKTLLLAGNMVAGTSYLIKNVKGTSHYNKS